MTLFPAALQNRRQNRRRLQRRRFVHLFAFEARGTS